MQIKSRRREIKDCENVCERRYREKVGGLKGLDGREGSWDNE